jgi:mannose-6-phosphate isomerase-like protein (cupin superfamily)
MGSAALLATLTGVPSLAQMKPAAPAPAATQAAPAAPARTAPRAATMTLAVQVTNDSGLLLPDVRVSAAGPVTREGTTGQDGIVRFATMRAGTYRLRLEHDGFFTLEREVTLRAGEAPLVDVTLNAAPPPPKPPEPPAPPPPPPAVKTLGPPGEMKLVDIPVFVDRNLIGARESRKDTVLGCAATGTGTLYQLRDPWTSHSHPDADEWLYVVAGQGALRLGSNDLRLQAGTFVLVPHTVDHTISPASRNPLILVSILSGAECTAP